jgi:hypothetical protein
VYWLRGKACNLETQSVTICCLVRVIVSSTMISKERLQNLRKIVLMPWVSCEFTWVWKEKSAMKNQCLVARAGLVSVRCKECLHQLSDSWLLRKYSSPCRGLGWLVSHLAEIIHKDLLSYAILIFFCVCVCVFGQILGQGMWETNMVALKHNVG